MIAARLFEAASSASESTLTRTAGVRGRVSANDPDNAYVLGPDHAFLYTERAMPSGRRRRGGHNGSRDTRPLLRPGVAATGCCVVG